MLYLTRVGQKRRVKSGMINVRNPADVTSIDVVRFCVLTPSRKVIGV